MKRRVYALLAATGLAVVASGCAVSPSGPGGSPTQENFSRVLANKSTAAEVRELLGPPSRVLKSIKYHGEEWGYRYRADFDRRVFWIEFSPDGIAREVSDAEDLESSKYTSP